MIKPLCEQSPSTYHRHSPRIAMLSTGEEVLFGDIVDTNACWISAELFNAGFQMTTRVTVGDSLEAISAQLSALAANHDVVIVNGGLGPTSDDMTAQAASTSANCNLVLFDEWVTRLNEMYQQWQRPMPQSNLKQAMLPAGSRLIDNPKGTACGFKLEIDGALCYFTPGVPHEFKCMFTHEILPDIQHNFIEVEKKHVHRIYTFGLSESGIANQIEALAPTSSISLGYRSALPFIEVKVFYPQLNDEVQGYLERVEAELKAHTVSINQTPVESTMELLSRQKLRLNIHDHVTFGYLHSWIAEQAIAFSVPVNSINQVKPEPYDVADENRTFQQLQDRNVDNQNGVLSILLTENIQGQQSITLQHQDIILSQQFDFIRQYSFKAKRVVISAIVLDMVRRHVSGIEVCPAYGSVRRVASKVLNL